MRSALRIVLFTSLLVLATSGFAQEPRSTGQHYWGFELGGTYSWFRGEQNFLWPMRQLFDDPQQLPYTIASYGTFNTLGPSPGFDVGLKLGLAMSRAFDLELKARNLMHFSSGAEDQTVKVKFGKSYQSEPVRNSYSLFLDDLDFDLLGHVGFFDSWYGAAGASFSTMLGNHINATQTQRGGDPWTYTQENTQNSTSLTSITMDGRLNSFFASSAFGVLVGAGKTWWFDAGTTLLDAELLLNIPLTPWLQDSGTSAMQSWANIEGKSMTYPKLWYATLTIGVRFPFGGHAPSEEPPVASTSIALPQPPPVVARENYAVLSGTVESKANQPISDAAITVVDLASGRLLKKVETDSGGRYGVRVEAPGKYSVTAEKNGYLFGTSYFEVSDDRHVTSNHSNIRLSEVANGRTPLLVFFDFNSAELRTSSYPELDRVVKLMKNSPSMQAEIAGYTDSVGSLEFNRSLSERRATAVRDYLLRNGIVASRVKSEGYGEESPIATNSTEEGRAENRRVEFVVLSK